MSVCVEVVVGHEASPASVWPLVAAAMGGLGWLEERYAVDDEDARPTALAQVAKRIGKRATPDSEIELYGEISSVSIHGNESGQIIWIENHPRDFTAATSLTDNLVQRLISTTAVVSGRVIDSNFQHLQMTSSLDELRKLGVDTSLVVTTTKKKKKSVAKISDNACRVTYHNGYVAGIGHIMWISEELFKRAESDRGAVVSLSLEQREVASGLTRVVFQREPFSAPSKLQQQLRAALFPLEDTPGPARTTGLEAPAADPRRAGLMSLTVDIEAEDPIPKATWQAVASDAGLTTKTNGDAYLELSGQLWDFYYSGGVIRVPGRVDLDDRSHPFWDVLRGLARPLRAKVVLDGEVIWAPN